MSSGDLKTPGVNGETLQHQPRLINYARAVLDFVLVIILVVIVATSIDVNNDDPSRSMHVHAVPVYLKSDLGVGAYWTASDNTAGTEAVKLASFKTQIDTVCTANALNSPAHPMCGCVALAVSRAQAKSCMLQHPLPAVYSDWNVVGVSPALLLWFMASLSTSVGTLPVISTYLTASWGEMPYKHTVISWNRFVVVAYVLLLVCTAVLPIVMSAVLFQGGAGHWGGLFNMLFWSALALVFLAVYNFNTFVGYLAWTKVKTADTLAERWAQSISHTLTVNNWILYVHLLISAPAIAVVIHLTQNWAEYHTIVNTTLLLSTVFAVDAFSAEMANYWAADSCNKDVTDPEPNVFGVSQSELVHFNVQLGLVRFIAWFVNAVLFLLLFTLAYPVDVGTGGAENAIFVVVSVVMGAVFLVPDLVREFTTLISFNNLQFRAYGDAVVRILVLFFVYRASNYEKVP
jgi:hypothetical protein